MVSRPTDCDPNRLRRLLDDRLDDLDQTAMAEHLETCAQCRQTLDTLAAGSRWWSETRMFLSPAPTCDFSETAAPRKTDLEPGLLDFLATSDDPAHLGRLGPYEIIEVIGRGGMGLVLRAIDPALNRHVAIKVLAPELATSATARRRFAREGQAAAAISHDHIVAIHSVDGSGGLPYLVMQLVTGKSLQERIDQTGPLAVEEILRIGMQTASGLAAAHAVGLIHRDIKPSNILLENCIERVKITDFGLARAVDDASLTQSGVVAGTPQYMSPEQARGEAADHRADLFSLGSVLYALCTGRPPFRADSTMAVLRRVSDDTPRSIRELNAEIPAWLAAIVTKLHAKDPADRFQSATEVADLLGRCLAYLREPTLLPHPFPVDPSPVVARRPHRKLAIAAGIAALALCALGAAEATGVTKFVATVLTFKTGNTRIVVKVNDKNIKVKLDDKDLVITGAGPEEIRVNAGVHRLQAMKNGKVISEKIESIARGGVETVEVSVEPSEPAVASIHDADRQRQQAELTTAKAEAELKRASERLDWSKKMHEKGYVAESRLDADQLGLEKLKLDTTLARRLLGIKEVPTALNSNAPNLIDRETEALRSRIQALEAANRQLANLSRNDVSSEELRAQIAHLEAKINRLTTLARNPNDPYLNSVKLTLEDLVAQAKAAATPQPAPETRTATPSLRRGGIFRPNASDVAPPSPENAATPMIHVTPGDLNHPLRPASQPVPINPPAPLPAPMQAAPRPVAPQPPTAAAPASGPAPAAPSLRPGASPSSDAPSVAPVPMILAPGMPERRPTPNPTPAVNPVGPVLVEGRGELAVDEPVGTAVFQVVLAPDGQTFATACDDGVVRIYDVASRAVVRELKDAQTFIHEIREVIDGKQISRMVATTRNSPRLWTVAYRPEGKTLVAAGGDFMDHEHPAAITVWDVPSGKVKARLQGHENTVFTLAISPDGQRLVSGGFDKSMRIWDLKMNTLIKSFDGHVDPESGAVSAVRSLAWNPNGESFASAGFDGILKIWGDDGRAIETVKNLGKIENDEAVGLNSLAYARDGKTLVVGGGTQAHVLIWKDRQAHEIKTFQFQQRILTVAISPDGKSVAAGGGNYGDGFELRTWDIDSALETHSLTEPGEWIESLVYTPDGKTLIAGGGIEHKPGFLTLWDLANTPKAATPTARPF